MNDEETDEHYNLIYIPMWINDSKINFYNIVILVYQYQ